MPEFELSLVVLKKRVVPPLRLDLSNKLPIGAPAAAGSSSDGGNTSQISLGIDFTFNTIKDVKRVTWKEDAPWYREISDGFSWLCYCHNVKCFAHKQLVVINKAYGVLSIKKELPNM